MRTGFVHQTSAACRVLATAIVLVAAMLAGSGSAEAALSLGDDGNPEKLAPFAAPTAGQPLYPRTEGRPPFGMSDNSWQEYSSGSAHLLTGAQVGEVIRSMNGTLVREPAYWPVIERKQGTDDWTESDALYRGLIRHGVRPVWIIAYTPRWAVSLGETLRCFPGSETCQGEPAPAFYGALGAFAGRLAERYPLSAAIEFRNEPNEPTNPSRIPAPEYTAELHAVFAGVKAANGAMRVLGGALSNSPGGDLPAYLSQILDSGGAGFMDGLSFHPYASGASADAMATTFGQVRDALAARKLLGMRLVPDELGAATAPTRDNGQIFTEAGQRDRLLYQWQLLDGARDGLPLQANVDAVLFYTTIEPAAATQLFGYGWLSRPSDGGRVTPKLVFCTFRREAGHVAGHFDGSSLIAACPAGEDGYVSTATTPKKKPKPKKKAKKKHTATTHGKHDVATRHSRPIVFSLGPKR
jgi:hypothetical protein